MTTVIHARNVNEAFSEGWWKLKTSGREEASRNGPVLVMPGPVITEYHRPWERVLFSPSRDANHVFHLMESIWLLAGRDDVAWLLPFNSKFEAYAEADGRQHGAYGFRWRKLFGHDQLHMAVSELAQNPTSRRVVIGMWHPSMDQNTQLRDVPCNTHIYLDVRSGKLNMTVCCRSNDMLWGAYGANAVHFSILQELLASALNIEPGVYRQFSNNFHVYLEVPGVKELLRFPPDHEKSYPHTIPLMERGETLEDFLTDCERFCNMRSTKCLFFARVAEPLRTAYIERKNKRPWAWAINNMPECDWKMGFQEWAARRGGE